MLSFLGAPDGVLGSGASGIPEDGALAQLQIQIQGVVVIFSWTAIVTWIILRLVGLVTKLRVDDKADNQGLDMTEHGERIYELTAS